MKIVSVLFLLLVATVIFSCKKDLPEILRANNSTDIPERPTLSSKYYFQAYGALHAGNIPPESYDWNWFTIESNSVETVILSDSILMNYFKSTDTAWVAIEPMQKITASNLLALKGKVFRTSYSTQSGAPMINLGIISQGKEQSTSDSVILNSTIDSIFIDDVIYDGEFEGKKQMLIRGHFRCYTHTHYWAMFSLWDHGVFSLRAICDE